MMDAVGEQDRVVSCISMFVSSLAVEEGSR